MIDIFDVVFSAYAVLEVLFLKVTYFTVLGVQFYVL